MKKRLYAMSLAGIIACGAAVTPMMPIAVSAEEETSSNTVSYDDYFIERKNPSPEIEDKYPLMTVDEAFSALCGESVGISSVKENYYPDGKDKWAFRIDKDERMHIAYVYCPEVVVTLEEGAEITEDDILTASSERSFKFPKVTINGNILRITYTESCEALEYILGYIKDNFPVSDINMHLAVFEDSRNGTGGMDRISVKLPEGMKETDEVFTKLADMFGEAGYERNTAVREVASLKQEGFDCAFSLSPDSNTKDVDYYGLFRYLKDNGFEYDTLTYVTAMVSDYSDVYLCNKALDTAGSADKNSAPISQISTEGEGQKLFDVYSKITDPSAIIWQGFETEKGAEYYVNDSGVVMIMRPEPNRIGVELSPDMDDESIYAVIAKYCPDAEVLRSNDPTMFPDTKFFEIYDRNVTLEMAKEMYSEFGDKAVGFKYRNERYKVGYPQYHISQHKAIMDVVGDRERKMEFTMYSGIENEEKLRTFIDENALPCHVEVLEAVDMVDVVPDKNVSYLEEIEIAAKIYSGLGLKCKLACMASAADETGDEIDLHNSVDGDSNCDMNTDISDAVLIMQSISNPEKYTMTAQGRYNADFGDDGITNSDALAIQKKLLMLE